jgi:hypothetical protein
LTLKIRLSYGLSSRHSEIINFFKCRRGGQKKQRKRCDDRGSFTVMRCEKTQAAIAVLDDEGRDEEPRKLEQQGNTCLLESQKQ